MKQALEAFKFSNISVDEYGSTTRESADVLCLYINIFIYNISIYMYLCGINFADLRTGVQCPLIEHDNNSGVQIIMLLNELNVYRFNRP